MIAIDLYESRISKLLLCVNNISSFCNNDIIQQLLILIIDLKNFIFWIPIKLFKNFEIESNYK